MLFMDNWIKINLCRYIPKGKADFSRPSAHISVHQEFFATQCPMRVSHGKLSKDNQHFCNVGGLHSFYYS
jgi:hypothetical protein